MSIGKQQKMHEPEYILLDLFSGYGGFHIALEQAGFKFKKTYFSEIDKHATANYRYNFPDAEWLGSIEHVSGWDIQKPDIVTFGWPCQDNSIAGKRKGQQSGTRSGLLSYAVEAINRFKPRVFIAENVEGLRTVNGGTDIIESLKLLTGLHEDCPQYDIEMQLLNTRWFIPQNRQRLFFVGHVRAGSTGKVFPITENDFKLDEQGERLSGEIRAKGYNEIANCLTRRMHKMGATDNYVTEVKAVLTPDRIEKRQNGRRFKENGEPAFTLNCQDRHGVMIDKIVRRLTPIECERLQGLPDNWTKYGNYDGIVKDISDTQRYKLCGNGVSIPPVKMIAERLIKTL